MKTLFFVVAKFVQGNATNTHRWATDATSCEAEFRLQRPDSLELQVTAVDYTVMLNTKEARRALAGEWGLAGEIGRAEHPNCAALTTRLTSIAALLDEVDSLLVVPQ